MPLERWKVMLSILFFSANFRFQRHCEEGALPDEAISAQLEIASSQQPLLAMTMKKEALL